MVIIIICAVFILLGPFIALLNNKFSWGDVAWTNIPGILILILLQWFYFFTAPRLESNKDFKDNFEKKEFFLKTILEKMFIKDNTLLIEIAAIGILLSLLNFFLFRSKVQKPIKLTIYLLIFFMLVSVISLALFVANYYEDNMAVG